MVDKYKFTNSKEKSSLKLRPRGSLLSEKYFVTSSKRGDLFVLNLDGDLRKKNSACRRCF